MPPAHPKPISMLKQLANIISASVDRIDAAMEKDGLEYPNPDLPFNPFTEAEEAAMSAEVREAAALALAACGQLRAIIDIPGVTLYWAIGGFHMSSALRTAVASNVVEILRAHPEGLNVTEISAQNGTDPTRLARILRALATQHIFSEVSPNVFKNNRLSSLMDTLKSVEEIKENPVDKHVGTPGMAAMIEHTGDEMFKASAYMTEVLLDPSRGHSESVEHAPLAVAFNTIKHCWEWYEEPGNEARLKRFGAAMAGTAMFDPPDAILSGFKWSDLPKNSVVVDVGGGIGHITLKLAQTVPDLKYIVQDRAQVMEEAKEFWDSNHPTAISSGNVVLQAHDFFSPQPKQDVSVFLCRMIVHDYPKEKASIILRNLREAANRETKLILVEQIVPYACPTESTKFDRKVQPISPPPPLLANLGSANGVAYGADLQMLVAFFGEERTIGTFIELTRGAGWEIVDIFPIPGSIHKQIVAVPFGPIKTPSVASRL